MGSPENEPNRFESEGPVRTVTFQRPFAIGKYEVTFAEYDRFAAASGRRLAGDSGWGRGSRPVINVSWTDAQDYIKWLNEKVKGEKFRLPTEAEWEYAARAGTTTAFSFEDDSKLGKYAWYSDNSEGKTHPVGEKNPNNWHLRDMHGNVWEWVEDDWHDNYDGAPKDGSDWTNTPRGAYRVICGGSWIRDAHVCRSANRLSNRPGSRFSGVGFRLSRSVTLGP